MRILIEDRLVYHWYGYRVFSNNQCLMPPCGHGDFEGSDFKVFASSILESWLGRTQAKGLGIRLAGTRAG